MSATLAAVERFNDAVARRDVAALRRAVTPDCVFECPKGNLFVGDDMIDAFERLLASPDLIPFKPEEMIVTGDRAIMRWTVGWDHGEEGIEELRGVDLFRVDDGLIAEMLTYVKDVE